MFDKYTLDQSTLKIGQKVHYQPSHYDKNRWENGIIKEIPDHTFDHIRVVYNCGGDWKNYKDYTSALTSLNDLKLGWKHIEVKVVDDTTKHVCEFCKQVPVPLSGFLCGQCLEDIQHC